MPRNSSGVYTVPAGTFAVTDTDISSSAYNAFLSDMSAAMTNSVNVQGTAPMLAAFNAGGFVMNNLAPGVAPTDAATLLQAQSALPSGSIIFFAANAPPTGFLECNGASLSTITNATLFAAIGFTFGGSGASFNIPDLRGQFIRGWDHGAGNDTNTPSRTFGSNETFANASHTHAIAQTAHTHSITDPQHAHSIVQTVHTHGATDSGHTHPFTAAQVSATTLAQVGSINGAVGSSPNTGVGTANITVAGAFANISGNAGANATNLSGTNISINAASATITGNATNAAGSPEVTVKNIAFLPCIKT